MWDLMGATFVLNKFRENLYIYTKASYYRPDKNEKGISFNLPAYKLLINFL